MRAKNFFNLFRKSSIDLFKNPILLLPGIFLWIFFFIVNKAGLKIAPLLTNTITNVAWVILITLVNFVVIAFIFGGSINLSASAVKNTKKDFFSSAIKFWIPNFIIFIFLFLIYNILVNGSLFLYTKFMLYILNDFEIPIMAFKVIAFLISAFWVCAVLLFLIYSNFFVVIKNQKTAGGIKFSIKFVKSHYLETILLSVIIFVTFFILSKLPMQQNIIDAVNYLIIIPFYTLLISRVILENDIRTK